MKTMASLTTAVLIIISASCRYVIKNEAWDQGNLMYENQNYNGAIIAYSMSIKANPNFIPAYHNRGMARHKIQDWEGAIADFSWVIGHDTANNNIMDYYLRGDSKKRLQDFEGATTDFNRVLEISPNSNIDYYARGNVKREFGDFIGAIDEYTKSIDRYPKFAQAFYDRGITKLELNQKDNACFDFRKALELGKKEAESLIIKYCQ